MTSDRVIEPVPSVPSAQAWGDEIGAESVNGVPFRMYSSRPHRLEEVLELAGRWGQRPYVVQGERVVTFAGLLGAVAEKSAQLLDLGVEPRRNVLLLGFNSVDWVVNFWACLSIGAVPVLANAWWSEGEVSDAIDLLEPAIALADARGAKKLPATCRTGTWEADLSGDDGADDAHPRADRPAGEGDPAVVIFTSGTSGRPKAAVLSHRSLLANLQMLLNLTRRLPHQVDERSGEVALHTGPLFHIGGGQMRLRSVVVGNTIVMPAGRFDPAEAIALIERHKVTRWAAVPTMVSRLLDHPDLQVRDVSSLRSVTIGGAPIHAELLQRIGSMLPSVTTGVPTGWGLTENGGQATAASGRDTLEHPGSAGRPLPLAELKFLPHKGLPDDEILVRSPTQMSGYAGDIESPIDAEGWLHTGDLGNLDEDGRLWITGRSKDLIIRGGENISPAAVERALMNIAGVVEAAVVGIPNPDLGEEVCAFVIVDHPSTTSESLRGRLQGELASFAVPSVWHVQQEPLPTNQTGKIDKPALARRAAALVGMEATDPDQTPMLSDKVVGGIMSSARVAEAPGFRHITPAFRTFCGTSAADALAGELDRLGCRRAVIFCDHWMLGHIRVLDRIASLLGERLVGRFAGVEQHSPIPVVEEASRELERLDADSVIAIGGGSAIVTARAASILHAEKRDVRELCTQRGPAGRLVSPKLLAPKLPIWVIATTPVTAYGKAGSALWDPRTGDRLALFDPKTRAQGLILDPQIALTAPASLAQASALNAFSMAIESLQASADPLADALLAHALRTLAEWLPKLGAAPDDGRLRLQLMIGALLAGQGSDYVGGGLAQAMAHIAGPQSSVANGIVEVILLPHALRFTAPVTPGRLRYVADALGGAVRSDASADECAIAAVEDFVAGLGVPRRLRDVGLSREVLAEAADHTMDDWILTRIPRQADRADLLQLLNAAW